MHTANSENHSHPNSAVSCQVYVRALIMQHLQGVFFKHDLVWSKIRKSLDTGRQKNWLKQELKKITIRIYSNCLIYFSLFFKSFKFCCCLFCLIFF